MEWRRIRLGDYISIKSGLAYSGSKIGKGDSVLLGMGCVSFKDKFVESGARPYDDICDDRFVVKPGDIVLATRQQSDNLPILAMPAIIPNSYQNKRVIFGTNLYKVENKSEINNRFLFWLFKHQHYVNYIAGVKSGTAVQMVTKKNVEDYKFLCPPANVRESISNILWTYDNLIENNNRRIRLLEKMAENLYKEWFVRFRFPGHEKAEFENGLPRGGKIEHIGDVCDTLGGGTPSTNKPEYWNGDIKWVTPTDITTKNSLPLLSIEGRITEEGVKNSSAKLLPPYTILMTSRASIGYFGLAPYPVCTNQGFISIIPNMVNMRMYILHNLMTRKDEIIMNANGATFLEISKGRFRKMKIVVPDDNTLNAFEKRANDIFMQVLKIEKQSTLLSRQRDLLLPRLMSGKLEVKV
jgi:type I restriction enzyme S subunit